VFVPEPLAFEVLRKLGYLGLSRGQAAENVDVARRK
jgi:predicted DNA-binding protein (UPF0251 family)